MTVRPRPGHDGDGEEAGGRPRAPPGDAGGEDGRKGGAADRFPADLAVAGESLQPGPVPGAGLRHQGQLQEHLQDRGGLSQGRAGTDGRPEKVRD